MAARSTRDLGERHAPHVRVGPVGEHDLDVQTQSSQSAHESSAGLTQTPTLATVSYSAVANSTRIPMDGLCVDVSECYTYQRSVCGILDGAWLMH